jgi:hypothetical protein
VNESLFAIQNPKAALRHQTILTKPALVQVLKSFSEQAVTKKTSPINIKDLYPNYHQSERAAVNILLNYNTRMQQILISLIKYLILTLVFIKNNLQKR